MAVLEQLAGERWRRLEPVLDAALELDRASWRDYLDTACAGDRALRADLGRLLEACALAEASLDQPALRSCAALLADAAAGASPIGARVGPYRLLEVLGQGGMGAVYLAERADGQFEQRVALKLVRGALAFDDQVVRRFLAERQILASLDHPHIARLLDGGITAEGLPWFAMEHVRGLTLVRYCDAHRLGIEPRLILFRTVCEAVHYAHQTLVIHRDLKPSNILVTESGVVKLLDFGIAKLLGGVAGAEPVTQTGSRAMTPEYASPEQLRGGPMTPASDVYSLGVILCELLVGRRPFRTDPRSPLDAERMILEAEPDPPSWIVARGDEDIPGARGTTRERLSRELRGDLDAIVATALRKEPERRYATPEQLASDIGRHVEHLPIAARGDDWVYRTRKFVRRHRNSTVAWTALVLATGLAILGLRMSIRGRAAAPVGSPASPPASVAVLPFAAAGAESEFAFGRRLAAAIVRQLSGIPDVRARSGDGPAPGSDARSARALNVRHLLSGRVEAVGPRLRVTAELVDAWATTRLWSSTYEGEPGDAEPLAQQVAREAAVALLRPTIAFTTNRDGNQEIYVMTLEGSHPINLTRHPGTDVDPAWSPDGRRIAFSSTRASNGNGFAVWVMNADGTGQTRLTDDPIGSEQAAWSPDGRRIVFMTARDFNAEIYVMNGDGGAIKNLSRHPAWDEQPAWSPDGRRIAFVSNRDRDQEIYIMNADGTAPRRLTSSPGMDYEPAWSPDGRRLAFWSGRNGNTDIYVMNADGSQTTRLTYRTAADFQPTWTPSGREILFHSREDGATDIYIMNGDGTDVRRLTTHPAVDMQPKVR